MFFPDTSIAQDTNQSGVVKYPTSITQTGGCNTTYLKLQEAGGLFSAYADYSGVVLAVGEYALILIESIEQAHVMLASSFDKFRINLNKNEYFVKYSCLSEGRILNFLRMFVGETR